MKPGSTTNELNETAKHEVRKLSHEDAIICSGTNDYELNKFSQTFHNTMSFIKNNKHTNILLMNVPYRHDLPNATSVNVLILDLNRKLQKLGRIFPHMSFVKTDTNRILYTNNGVHLNKIGKQLVQHQLVPFLDSTFEQKRAQPIILGSHKILENNNIICDGNQMLKKQEINDANHENQTKNIACDSELNL